MRIMSPTSDSQIHYIITSNIHEQKSTYTKIPPTVVSHYCQENYTFQVFMDH